MLSCKQFCIIIQFGFFRGLDSTVFFSLFCVTSNPVKNNIKIEFNEDQVVDFDAHKLSPNNA